MISGLENTRHFVNLNIFHFIVAIILQRIKASEFY